VLRESSNICAAKIGEKLGKQRLIEGLRAFGFGEKTAWACPVKPEERWPIRGGCRRSPSTPSRSARA